jgi:hypothetical protein
MSRAIKPFLVILLLIFGGLQYLKSQIGIQPSSNAEALAQHIMGNGVVITQASLQAYTNATAFFTAANTNLGINEGAIFSTGSAPTTSNSFFTTQGCPLIPGLSSPMGSDAFASTYHSFSPDEIPELNGIISPQTLVYDAVKLSVQFIALEASFSVQYVFASEEFPVWMDPFLDFFVILISGPGINGFQNIARVPGSNQPVNVGTIGNQFINNNGPTWHAYDGFSPVYTASINLMPNQVYTVHFIIADVSDSSFDSAVFIKKNQSTNSNLIQTDIQSYQNDDTIIEGCTGAQVTFTRSMPYFDSLWIYLQYSGAAQYGIDYPNLPDSIVIPSGENSVMLSIDALQDHLDEGIESLIITYQSLIDGIDSITLFISDQPNVTFSLADTIAYCLNNGPIALQPEIISGIPPFTYSWNGEDSEDAVLHIETDTSQLVFLTISDFCLNTLSDSVYINVFESPIPLPPDVLSNSPVCSGNELFIQAEHQDSGLFYWNGPNDFISSEQNLLFPSSQSELSGVYEVYVSVGGCVSDKVSINVTVHTSPGIPEFDSANPYCNGSNIFMNTFATGANSFVWSGPNGFSSTNPFNTISNAGAEHEGVYEVVASNPQGCTSTGIFELIMLNVDNLISYNSGVLFTEFIDYQSLQWLDCNNNFVAIPGETLPFFILNQDGSYALQVTLEHCVDTSACFVFTHAPYLGDHSSIVPFPNPSSGWLSFKNLNEPALLQLFDAQGRLVKNQMIQAEELVDFSASAKGIYLIRLLRRDQQIYHGKLSLHNIEP